MVVKRTLPSASETDQHDGRQQLQQLEADAVGPRLDLPFQFIGRRIHGLTGRDGDGDGQAEHDDDRDAHAGDEEVADALAIDPASQRVAGPASCKTNSISSVFALGSWRRGV